MSIRDVYFATVFLSCFVLALYRVQVAVVIFEIVQRLSLGEMGDNKLH